MKTRPRAQDSGHSLQEWKMPPREWAEAKTQFAIMFGERFVRT
jgi:transposase-like protein